MNQGIMIEMTSSKDKHNNSIADEKSSIKDSLIVEEPEGPARQPTSMLSYIIILLAITAIPIVNLILFEFQPISLARGLQSNKDSLIFQNLGKIEDYTLFYVTMALYAILTAVFIFYTVQFSTPKQRFKQYFLVDNILICMLAANVTYAALHVIYFCGIYSSDYYFIVGVEYIVNWQDIVIIILYSITNLTYSGIFRILMVNVDWKPCQMIVLKLLIILSSLAYITVGLIYISGKDTIDQSVEQFATYNTEFIDDVVFTEPNNYQYLDLVTWVNRQTASLADSVSIITDFMLLYVFTNFAFSFEIVAKFTDFDGTSDLKTTYELVNDQ